MNIGILGAGTWGIALARMLDLNGHNVTVWSVLPREIEQLEATRSHPNLPGIVLPAEIGYTTSMAEACRHKDIILFAVPSVFVRSTAEKAAPLIAEDQIIVDVAKGIEEGTLFTMTEVIADALVRATGHSARLVALSGPTHAEEVAKDMPSSIVSASKDDEAALAVQDAFMNTCMRIYTNNDVKGVELCGALKNIVALASGISAGLGYGDNTRAALITRGMGFIFRSIIHGSSHLPILIDTLTISAIRFRSERSMRLRLSYIRYTVRGCATSACRMRIPSQSCKTVFSGL